MSAPLLSLEGVTRRFVVERRPLVAVDDVSLALEAGDVVSVVGESGSGKTTLGRLICDLDRPTAGSRSFRGQELGALDRSARRAYRLDVQLVHQDPYASLNPSQTIGAMLAAPLRRHRGLRGAELERRVHELLRDVELTPPEQIARKHPHELSGGQRQRAAIARALTVDPELLVADEAVSMVDVSLRLSILDMLRALRERRGMAVVFITHDLAVARHFARDGRVAVMYLGRVVEVGAAADVIGAPQHPYTRALVEAARLDPSAGRVARTAGDAPSPLDLPSGCAFHPRCPEARSGCCELSVPALRALDGSRRVACHLRSKEQV